MSVLKLTLGPVKNLRRVALPVEEHEFDENLHNFCSSMLDTMYHYEGVGLAAPQVGLNKRIILMDIFKGNIIGGGRPLALINPVIIEVSDEKISIPEGCLSFPDLSVEIERYSEVKVAWRTLHGQELSRVFRGLESIVLQHEIEHLDGKTIFDYLGKYERNRYIRKQLRKS